MAYGVTSPLTNDNDLDPLLWSTSSEAPALLKKWAVSTLGGTSSITNYRHSHGAASLINMCWRSLLRNLHDLDADTLSTVPWPIAVRLWKQITKNDLISVSTWMKFVTAYHHDITTEQPQPQSLMLHINTPPMSTNVLKPTGHPSANNPPRYITEITAPAFEWLNILSIVAASLSSQSWIVIAKVTNLGALYIQGVPQQEGHMSDTVIKAWSYAAVESGAFRHLKLLLLQGQPHLSIGILQYLANFPVLKILHFSSPRYHAEQVKHLLDGTRWIWMHRSSLCLKLFASWHARESMGRRLTKAYQEIIRAELGKETPQPKPLLNIMCGPAPYAGISGRPDQLWFELESKPPQPDDTTESKCPTVESPKRETDSASLSRKKLKLRQGAQKSMTDLFAQF